jgi:membrane protein DedA with SNARE-associated domain
MIDRTYIYLIHILIVAPLFIYTGYLGDKLATGQNKEYKKFFWLLIAIAVVIILYHSFLLLKYKDIF